MSSVPISLPATASTACPQPPFRQAITVSSGHHRGSEGETQSKSLHISSIERRKQGQALNKFLRRNGRVGGYRGHRCEGVGHFARELVGAAAAARVVGDHRDGVRLSDGGRDALGHLRQLVDDLVQERRLGIPAPGNIYVNLPPLFLGHFSPIFPRFFPVFSPFPPSCPQDSGNRHQDPEKRPETVQKRRVKNPKLT